jgi:hypothetical protein
MNGKTSRYGTKVFLIVSNASGHGIAKKHNKVMICAINPRM